MHHSFEISERPASVGGGWRMQLLEDGEEVGGGVFPPGDDAYCDAYQEASEWLSAYQLDDLDSVKG